MLVFTELNLTLITCCPAGRFWLKVVFLLMGEAQRFLADSTRFLSCEGSFLAPPFFYWQLGTQCNRQMLATAPRTNKENSANEAVNMNRDAVLLNKKEKVQ